MTAFSKLQTYTDLMGASVLESPSVSVPVHQAGEPHQAVSRAKPVSAGYRH